jgi:uncharacterized protein YoxC
MGSGIQKRARDVVKPALERIEALEKNFTSLLGNQQNLLEGTNQALGMVEQRINTLERLMSGVVDNLDALSRAVGAMSDAKFPSVEQTVTRHIHEQATSRADMEKAALATAVETGRLIVGDSIGEQSVIVGREILKDGTVRHPGWEQLLFGQLQPDLMSSFLGKRVGDRIASPAGEFEVLEIYEIILAAPSENAPVAADDVAAEEVAAPESVGVLDADEGEADKALDEYLADSAGPQAN